MCEYIAAQAMWITRIKEDTSDQTVSMSGLAVRGFNAFVKEGQLISNNEIEFYRIAGTP